MKRLFSFERKKTMGTSLPGKLSVLTYHNEVHRIVFHDHNEKLVPPKSSYDKEAFLQLKRYFKDPHFIFDLNIKLSGTDFQKKVWKELQKIPVGETRTYGELAKKLHSSPRAIGNACRKNPMAIVIPCHRVVSKNGLGGFCGKTQGDALDLKFFLLKHESQKETKSDSQ